VVVCLLIGVWLQRELSFDNFHPAGIKFFDWSTHSKVKVKLFRKLCQALHLERNYPGSCPQFALPAACSVINTK
jgi:hypothetical protein